jgi:WD40 repeat protein
VWNLGRRSWSKEQAVLSGGWGPVRTVAFSRHDPILAFGGVDQRVRLWDYSGSAEDCAVLQGHAGVVRLVQFNPDGKTLLSLCDGGRVIRWNVSTGTKEREWLLPRGRVYNGVAFTHDGRYLAAGDSAGCVTLFRLYPRRDKTP